MPVQRAWVIGRSENNVKLSSTSSNTCERSSRSDDKGTLHTGIGRSNTNLSKWGYADAADIACEFGTSEQTMQHLLRCPLLENECSLEDLATANEKALHCARAWPNIYDPVQG